MQVDLPLSGQKAGISDLLAHGLAAVPFAALLFRPNDNLTLLWRNRAHEVMSASEGRELSGKGMFEAFPPNDDGDGDDAVIFIRDAAARIKATGTPEDVGPVRFDLMQKDGTYAEHHWQMNFAPINIEGEVVAILQTAQDVTDAVLAQRLAESHRRTSTSTASVAYFSFDPETDRFIRHDAIDAMFGFAPDEAGPYATPFFERVHPDDVPAVHAEVARVMAAPPGEIASFDYRVALPDGGERFVRIRAELATDPVDRRLKLVGTFVDLTDIENDRRALAKAVSLSEALVQEANHRIKNSLQIALSLLRFEANKLVRDKAPAADSARAALRAVEARVRAVAEVHGLMQIDETVATTDLCPLFDRLVASTRKSAELPEAAMVFDAPRHPVAISSDKAIALGLMLNELLTNAIKHGAPDLEHPVTLNLHVAPDGGVHVLVKNAHSSDTPRLDIDSTGTGERLIQQFGEQIGAEVTRSKTETRFEARIILPPES